MTVLWSWSSSADTGFSSTAGAAPSVETAGSYGERYSWAGRTTIAYGVKTQSISGDMSVRFIYTMAARPSTSFMVFSGNDTTTTDAFRADITAAGQIRIRNASATVRTGTAVLALDTEYRFEVSRAGTTLTFKVYKVSDDSLVDSITGTVPGTALTNVKVGNNAPITGTLGPITYDEIVLRDVAGEIGPVAGSNAAPTANAGADRSVSPYSSVTLDGSGSDSDGSIASYAWTKVSGPTSLSALSSTSTAKPSYKTLGTIAGHTDVWRLTVTDNGGATGSDDVSITVLPVKQRAVIGGVEVPIEVRVAKS